MVLWSGLNRGARRRGQRPGRKVLDQCVTNAIFSPEYEYEYIWVDNTNIFGSHFLDEYEYEYIRAYQKWANINTDMIIWTDICEHEHECEYYHIKNKKINRYIYGYKSYTSMQIIAHCAQTF